MRHFHGVLVEPSCYVMLISLAVADVYILLYYFFHDYIFFASLFIHKESFRTESVENPNKLAALSLGME